MVNIKPTIEIYDNDGNLSKTYNKAINKMIDQTFDIDLEQFDFDEVAKGKCKEFDDLVTKLCDKSGLGSDDIYSMLLERFIGEYDMDYDVNYVYGLDEFEESKKSSRKSLKESAKPINENNVAKFVDEVNKWCDDNIHYVDMDAENFTKKYGKLYNFKYREEGDFYVIYDSEGTLDLFDREASLVYSTLDKLAKKNGWYIDPYSCACNFTFGEI